MTNKTLPEYPIYIPSKGRWNKCLTARFLEQDKVPYYLVIEPQEYNLYRAYHGKKPLLVLPFSNMGSVIPARNWILEHSKSIGAERHWQLDDNINGIWRWYKGKRLPCNSGVAFAATEDFVNRYENIAIAGLNYYMFCRSARPPFVTNVHVYSCTLFLNSLPHRWRGKYNEDTDICLQVLADGWCTVLLNCFVCDKEETMRMKGGNTDALYKPNDGRLKMSRSLERVWPGAVSTTRRFKRPQHIVYDNWQRFDTPLKLKKDIDLGKFPRVDEYGLELVAVRDEVKSPRLREMVDKFKQN